MAISLNGGTGVITGVSVGGLPDGIVDTDMIAADAVTAAKIGSRTFTSYAIICDQKAQDTDGGTFTAGAWQTRDLNTEIFDPDDIVSISSNQFTLSSAGTYYIEAFAPSFGANSNVARLYNITDNSVAQVGSHSYSRNSTGDLGDSKAWVHARVTITGSTTFEIQHRCDTSRTTNGFGVGANLSVEIYTVVKIYKEA